MIANQRLIYHQRETLERNVCRYIRATNAETLLDIGAGLPSAALPISKCVRRYLGVEVDAENASALRAAGLEIIEGRFPLDIKEEFDLVLSSHSIPESNVSAYPSFLSAAVERVRPGGTMLIITFKGNKGEIAGLTSDLLKQPWPSSPEKEMVEDFFNRLGNCTTEIVNSYIEATHREILAEFLWRWLTAQPQIKTRFNDELLEWIDARYLVRENLYVFPTEHLFISYTKT